MLVAPCDMIAVEKFFGTPRPMRESAPSVEPTGHLHLCGFPVYLAARFCVAGFTIFLGNSGNGGNSLINIGFFFSEYLGTDWEQQGTGPGASSIDGHFVPTVPKCRNNAGNAQISMNTACSHCSHLFPVLLRRLRENIEKI
jgi:hypothetical protein